MTIARTAIDDVFDGATAVLGARSVPPIIVTQTIGTGRFDRHRNAIEIDPKVLTWPLECRRFLGAHEAAHAIQSELPRRWALIVLAVVMTGYLAFVSAAAIKFGFGDDLIQLAIEATFCTGMVFLVLIETVLHQCRRLEYQADHAAAAAVGTAGIIQWQRIAQAELSQTTRTMLAINAATGLRTHPTWHRRISAVNRVH